jgi:serine protease Do
VVLQTDVIVTNQHVVKQQTSVVLHYADGLQSKGTVLAGDAKTDLAVVKTDRKNLPVPRWRDGLPRTGDQVLAIGSPLGFENTVTAGIVSGLHRQLPGEQGDSMSDLLQTDAPISPGNSGGALLDVQGRVIGISEAYIPPSAGAVSLGFAIPSPAAKDVADQLLKSGKVDHPYLGVSLGSLTPSIRQQLGIKTESGAIVLGVDPRGPAAAAGIRVGDVIIKFGDTDVHGPDDILSALRKAKPGQAVPVRVVRGDKVTDLKVTLAGR